MRIILFLGITIIFFSCVNKDFSYSNYIDLRQKPDSKIKNLSDIALYVDYIPLQTSENNLIPRISDIKTCDSLIYILLSFKEILCFDKTGKYLHKLSKLGRGPDEYLGIDDFDIVSDDSLIVLTKDKILIYSLSSNEYFLVKTLSFQPPQPSNLDFITGQNSILLSFSSVSGDEPFRNLIISLNGDTLKFRLNFNRYIKKSDFVVIIRNENLSYRYNNMLYFKEMFSDTIFTLDLSNNFLPYIIFNSHGKMPTAQERAKSDEFNLSDYRRLTNILEVRRYLFYELSYKQAGHSIFYDKISNEKKEINSKSQLKDDIIGGIDIIPGFCSNEKFYSWIDAITLKTYVSTKDFKNSTVRYPDKKRALKNLADSLEETSNPILIVITPKE